jgi:hypothetical protein
MSAEKFYKPVRSIPVEGSSWASVDALALPSIKIPFREGHLPSLCRVVVRSRGDNKTSPQLVQISPVEKRTFQVQFGRTKRIIFEDEYGNLFGSLDLKGNKSTIIKVKKIDHSPSGFSFWGIQESDSIARAVKASEYLRAHNIDTEVVLKIMQPEQIPYKGKVYSPEVFKTQLLVDTATRVSSGHRPKGRLKPDDIPSLASVLEGMEFVQTLRGKQVNERIYDLHNAPADVVQQMIQNAFWFYNYRGLRTTGEGQFTPLDPDNSEDVDEYFNRTLPWMIGQNYGAMHKSGVIHVHPHLQNISMTGGIYDTDSVRGAPLGFGDAEITDDDTVEEIQKLLYGYWNQEEGKGLIPFLNQITLEDRLPVKNAAFLTSAFESRLLISYIFARGWTDDLLSHAEKINRILGHHNRLLYSFSAGHFLELLNGLGQWPYEFELEDVEGVGDEMFSKNADFWREQLKGGIEERLFVRSLFEQSHETAFGILRRKVYKGKPQAFDSVKEERGEEISEALLDLVAQELTIIFPLRLLDIMYGDKKEERDHAHAVAYLASKVKN